MKNRKGLRIGYTFIIFIFLGISVLGYSQTDSFNRKRMDRDLRIMEGVLDKLLAGKSSVRFFNGHTKGLYIKNFGIVFHTQKSGPAFINRFEMPVYRVHEHLKELMEEKVDQKIREPVQKNELTEEQDIEASDFNEADLLIKTGLHDKNVKDAEKQAIEELKDKIDLFFQNYTPAIGQLQPQDRVAVLVNFQNWEMDDSKNAFLSGSIIKKDLDQFRKNQLSRADFYKQILFQVSDPEKDITKDVEIMSEIIDRSMNISSFTSEASNSGIYIDGLGSLFFIHIPGTIFSFSKDGNEINILARGEYGKAAPFLAKKYSDKIDEKTEDKEDNSYDEHLKKIQDELFDIMASYGHTLRLKPEERIIFNVDMGERLLFYGPKSKSPSRFVFQLVKKDLDNYNSGLISKDDLEKKLIFHNY